MFRPGESVAVSPEQAEPVVEDDATGQLVANCPQVLGVETPSGGADTFPSPKMDLSLVVRKGLG